MTASASKGSSEPNASVHQVFDVLEMVSAAPDAVGVADVARSLGLSTSTAHRVLATLNQAGYLGRDPTGTKYALGIVAHELAEATFRRFPIRAAAQETLRRLVELTGETASLDVQVGWHVACIAGDEGTSEIHSALRSGDIKGLDESGPGRVILSWLSDDDRQAFPRGRSTRASAALAAIRRRGYEIEELGTGVPVRRLTFPVGVPVRRLTFPVLNASGTASAALSIEGTASQFQVDPRSTTFRAVHGVVAELEVRVQGDPDLTRDPYAHLDREQLSAQLASWS
jgi:IclR family transcriptional regulator, acetate operon repressor